MARCATRWTPEREQWLRDAVNQYIDADRIPEWTKIGPKLGVKSDAARMKWRAMRHEPDTTPAQPPPPDPIAEMPPPPEPEPFARVAIPGTQPDIRDFLDIPPRPFAVPIPFTAKRRAGGLKVALHWTDTHFPFQDDQVLAVVASLAQELQPDVLIHGGDLLDCYGISKFDKDPTRRHSLQDEIDQAKEHLHQMAQIVPHAERWLLEGNHEDRLRRTIWSLPGGAAELARLTSFQEAMSWPVLLGLDEIGWKWVPADKQSHTSIIPKLITKHGTVVRKWSSYTARGEWERYGRGGLSGHTHRMGGFYHRDHNGAICWWEGGCTCDLNPSYMMDPDWQNGCLVITWDESDGRFSVEPVFIQDGAAIFRGERLTA